MAKYLGEPRLDENAMKATFKEVDFVFVQDMSDLFADSVPEIIILKVMNKIASSNARFLLLTKNPKRYVNLLLEYGDNFFTENVVLGATIESDLPWRISNAPSQPHRLLSMMKLVDSMVERRKLFVSIEPIMDFSNEFGNYLRGLNLWGVAVGYDNYGNDLYEPSLLKTKELIGSLRTSTTVFEKTLREARIYGNGDSL